MIFFRPLSEVQLLKSNKVESADVFRDHGVITYRAA